MTKATLFVCFLAAGLSAQQPTFHTSGLTGASGTFPTGIKAARVVAGMYETASAENASFTHGLVRATDGTIRNA
jgi:hypothetical protein